MDALFELLAFVLDCLAAAVEVVVNLADKLFALADPTPGAVIMGVAVFALVFWLVAMVAGARQ